MLKAASPLALAPPLPPRPRPLPSAPPPAARRVLPSPASGSSLRRPGRGRRAELSTLHLSIRSKRSTHNPEGSAVGCLTGLGTRLWGPLPPGLASTGPTPFASPSPTTRWACLAARASLPLPSPDPRLASAFRHTFLRPGRVPGATFGKTERTASRLWGVGSQSTHATSQFEFSLRPLFIPKGTPLSAP